MNSKCQFVKWVVTAVGIALLPFSLLTVHHLRTISREKNSNDILRAVIQLEFTKASLVNVSGRPTELLTKTWANKQVDAYMAQRGWHRIDQMGAIHYFGKGTQKMRISSRQITTRYRFYELEKQP